MARLTRTPTSVAAQVRGYSRSFGETTVIRDLDLDIAPGELVALLGRSGCGKSTLLRALAGLDPAPEGQVQVHGRSAVAFQEPRLLPWRRVRDNVALALREGTAAARRSRAATALAEVGLEDKAEAWPLRLSGGQAQRVSLARAMVAGPDLLLLDEPFSALDALTRIEMHRLLLDLWREHSMAVLLVTHDVEEALALADRLLVMGDGAVAGSWRLDSPRSERGHGHPDVEEVRGEVLAALGVPLDDTHPTHGGPA